MTELKTRSDVEVFGFELRRKLVELPSNVLLLVIMEEDDFDKLHMEINGQHAETDRIIYNTQAGIEFGIKISKV